jgi:aminoglycoside 3-N-acetyltransferase
MTIQSELPLVTRSQLIRDFKNLGLVPGQTIMLHASVRAVGWIVGGPDVVLQALLDLLTPAGTLMMYVAWEDRTDHLPEWPAERQAAYLAECPPFDPATSRANRKWSILTEYLRTLPGACRSANPGASVAAIGAKAQWITENHPLQFGYGPGSPLAKLCQAGGQVLLLGVSLDTLTLLHYSEHVVAVPNKRTVRYPVPVLQNGQRVWVDVQEFDTSRGIVDWDGEDYFALIARDFLALGNGRRGMVGAARSYLFDAAALHEFAVQWMQQAFGAGQEKPIARRGDMQA